MLRTSVLLSFPNVLYWAPIAGRTHSEFYAVLNGLPEKIRRGIRRRSMPVSFKPDSLTCQPEFAGDTELNPCRSNRSLRHARKHPATRVQEQYMRSIRTCQGAYSSTLYHPYFYPLRNENAKEYEGKKGRWIHILLDKVGCEKMMRDCIKHGLHNSNP